MPQYLLRNGVTVEMTIRPDTNDDNVCRSILMEDEYRLPRDLEGVAVDVGAHIGAATVALLILNPGLRVVAIEPVPDNVELLRANTARFGDRVEIIEGAAGKQPTHVIRYGYTGDESASVHRFIGNQHMPPGTPFRAARVPGVSLSALVEQYGPIAFLKIDCEGCEHDFLDDPAIGEVALIHGEWHDGATAGLRFGRPCRVRYLDGSGTWRCETHDAYFEDGNVCPRAEVGAA